MLKAFHSIGVIFRITFKQIIWSKRTIFFCLIILMPIGVAIFYKRSEHAPVLYYEFFARFVIVVFLHFLALLLSLFYGTAVMGDEIDNKTITYLFTRPIQKYCIILGKYLSLVLGVFLLLLPSISFTYVLMASKRDWFDILIDIELFFRYLCVLSLALMAYSSIFMLFGTLFKRSVLYGLLFAFGWETVMSKLPGTIKQLTLMHYFISLFPRDHISGDPIFKNATSFETSIMTIIGATLMFICLSIFVIYRKEYKFDITAT